MIHLAGIITRMAEALLRNNCITCPVCKANFHLDFPMSAEMFAVIGKQFAKEHKLCGERNLVSDRILEGEG